MDPASHGQPLGWLVLFKDEGKELIALGEQAVKLGAKTVAFARRDPGGTPYAVIERAPSGVPYILLCQESHPHAWKFYNVRVKFFRDEVEAHQFEPVAPDRQTLSEQSHIPWWEKRHP